MFIISGLTVLLLYNGIEQNQCSNLNNVKYPVGATNFFLFFIVPLFIFNYFGSLYNSESGMGKVLQGLFFACLLIWWLSMVLWAFYKLNIYKQIFQKSSELDPPQKGFENYCNFFFFFVGGLGVPPVLFVLWLFNDLSQVFLFSCIVGSVAAVLAKTTVKPLKELCAAICCKKGSANTGSTGAGPAETDPAGAGPAKTDPAGAGPAETDPAGAGPAETDPAGAGPAKTDPAGAGPEETDPAGAGPAETDPAGAGPAETDPAGAGPAETDPAGAGPEETDPAGAGPEETDPAGAGPAKTDPAGAGPAKTDPANTGCRWLIGFQAGYIVVTVGLLVFAVVIFSTMPTTDKTSTPENSRDENKECAPFGGGFFDWHDLWHIFSSFALLMGAIVVMFVSAEPVSNPTEKNEVKTKENVVAGGEQQGGRASDMEMVGLGVCGGGDGDSAGQ